MVVRGNKSIVDSLDLIVCPQGKAVKNSRGHEVEFVDVKIISNEH